MFIRSCHIRFYFIVIFASRVISSFLHLHFLIIFSCSIPCVLRFSSFSSALVRPTVVHPLSLSSALVVLISLFPSVSYSPQLYHISSRWFLCPSLSSSCRKSPWFSLFIAGFLHHSLTCDSPLGFPFISLLKKLFLLLGSFAEPQQLWTPSVIIKTNLCIMDKVHTSAVLYCT